MSTSQTTQAFSSIINALCDIRVDSHEVAMMISRSSQQEQSAVAEFVKCYMLVYSMNHEMSNFVNDNMQISNWAWQMVNAIDKEQMGEVH